MAAQQEMHRTLSDDAIAMLRARNTADLRAAASLQETAMLFGSQRDDAGIPVDAAERAAYLSLQRALLFLLYELLCGEELLWYETYDPAKHQDADASDLCKTLRHFLNMADLMTGNYLAVGAHEIPRFLYANVQPERLIFVLLHQLIRIWDQDITLNTVELFASKEHGELRIDLMLRRDEHAGTDPLPEPESPVLQHCGVPDAAAALTERFCKLYGARLIRRDSEGARGCSLSLPAAGMMDTRLQLHSDGAPPIVGARTIYHAVLAALVPTEAILWGDVCDD